MQGNGDVVFGGSGLNRAAHLRGQGDEIARLWQGARVLPFWRGKPLLLAEGGTQTVGSDHPVLAMAGLRVFLGLAEDGRAEFAADISTWEPESGNAAEQGFFDQSRQPHPSLGPDPAFEDLRNAMMRLSPRQAELAAMARALLHWHGSHGFCAACGARSEVVQAGWQRSCPACGAQHFPRTDPCVIMLAVKGERCLLGRSPRFGAGMWSCLAGFVEPGESFEDAVAREVYEEVRVKVKNVTYRSSQPWPFPASVMIGFHAEAESLDFTVNEDELASARWMSREDLKPENLPKDGSFFMPRRDSIARRLIEEWLGHEAGPSING